MGMAEKVGGGDGWRTIAAVEMRDSGESRDSGDSSDRDTGIWIRWRRRRGRGDRRDVRRWT